jgi:hypothetical protein
LRQDKQELEAELKQKNQELAELGKEKNQELAELGKEFEKKNQELDQLNTAISKGEYVSKEEYEQNMRTVFEKYAEMNEDTQTQERLRNIDS